MLKPLLLFSLLVWAIPSNAQVKEITGLVIYNNERQSGAIIKNLSSREQTISTDRGEFVITAKPGDTLITIKDDYIKDTLLVSDQQYLIIKFRKNPLMLKEVNIYGIPITPASTYEANKNEYKEIYWKGDKSHIFMPDLLLGTHIGLTFDITKLYNALSKQGHDARRLQHTLTKDYKNSIVDKRFNPLAANITGYKGQKLLDFIKDNRPSYEMVVKATDYNIIQYIKGKLSWDKKK